MLVDGNGATYPLITTSVTLYPGGDALLLIDGLVYNVNLPGGAIQLPSANPYYTQLDCTGPAYTTTDTDFDNFAIAPAGATATGQPVYRPSGSFQQLGYVSQTNGNGSCENNSGSAQLRPVSPAGTIPAGLPRPLTVDWR